MFDEIRAQFFPKELVPGISAYAVDPQDFNVIWEVFDQVFPTMEGAYQPQTPTRRELQRANAATHHEHILLKDEQGELAGWSWGQMIDSSTFFMTNSGILPDYRRRGIYGAFLTHFLLYLETLGYERITSNHQINNRAILIAKLKAGFNINGMDLHEQWGAQVSLVYFPDHDRLNGFASAFAVEQRDKL